MQANKLNTIWLAGCVIDTVFRGQDGLHVEATKSGTFTPSRLEVLQFKNLDPSNMTTIYTGFHFV